MLWGASEVVERLIGMESFRHLDFRQRVAVLMDLIQELNDEVLLASLWGRDEAFEAAFRNLYPEYAEQLAEEARESEELDEEDEDEEEDECSCEFCEDADEGG
jgi:hypothetical protein